MRETTFEHRVFDRQSDRIEARGQLLARWQIGEEAVRMGAASSGAASGRIVTVSSSIEAFAIVG
jgi:hypothetical protein